MFEPPLTVQRSLPSNFARSALPPALSGSGVGTSVICAVSHVGAAQPVAGASARRTRTCMTIGSMVFGYRNVSFELVVSPFRAIGVPLTCDHSNFAAPTEPEASSVSGRFCRTVAPTGAMTARAGFVALTVTSIESARVWPLPVTVSVNVTLPAVVGGRERRRGRGGAGQRDAGRSAPGHAVDVTAGAAAVERDLRALLDRLVDAGVRAERQGREARAVDGDRNRHRAALRRLDRYLVGRSERPDVDRAGAAEGLVE